MFCSKCGAQLKDDAVFCTACGNPVTKRPEQNQVVSNGGMPSIISNLLNRLVSFFTKNDQVAVVADSVNDNTFSGLILAGFGIIMYALAAMVNVNQGASSIFGTSAGVSSGLTLLWGFLTALLVYAAAAGMIFVVLKFICKKDITIQGSSNLVAYASIPMICVFIINMLLGLIWFPLPYIFLAFAFMLTTVLVYSGISKVIGSVKTAFIPFVIVAAVVAIVAMLFICLVGKSVIRDACTGIFSSGLNDIGTSIMGSIFGGLGF